MEIEKIQSMIEPIFKKNQDSLAQALKDYYEAKEFEIIYQPKSYLYIKSNAKADPIKACFVAHLDTVHKKLPREITIEKHKNKTIVSSANGIGADDRCGVLASMILRSELDDRVNLLFTFDEEIGGLGIKRLISDGILRKLKEDNNIYIEFDRKGSSDYVTYGYENSEAEAILKQAGFSYAIGSYSDVSDISRSGTFGVNISAGYYKAHTKNEYFVIEELQKNIERIKSTVTELAKVHRATHLKPIQKINDYIVDRDIIEYILDRYEELSMMGFERADIVDFIEHEYNDWDLYYSEEEEVQPFGIKF